MNKEVAIITPVFKATTFISNLLESISSQTCLNKIKLFLIVDGDGQNYDFLLKTFSHVDMDIQYLEVNCGPGIARNYGIKKVIKEKIPYIIFADSDDEFYGKYAIHFLLSAIKREDIKASLIYTPILMEQETEEQLALFEEGNDGFLFGKIYKTDIIEKYNITFFPLYNEDGCFNLEYYICSNEGFFELKQLVYLWKFNPQSIGRSNNYEHNKKAFYNDIEHIYETYQHLFNNVKVSQEDILITIPGNLIKLYLQCYNRKKLLSSEEYLLRLQKIADIKNRLTNIFPQLKSKKIWQAYGSYYNNWEVVYNLK